MNDILTITKEELIDILTKSGHYHEVGIEIALNRGSLAGVLKGIMCDVDSLEHGKDYYKSEVRWLRSERKEMEKYIERSYEYSKSKYKKLEEFHDMIMEELELPVNGIANDLMIARNRIDILRYYSGAKPTHEIITKEDDHD